MNISTEIEYALIFLWLKVHANTNESKCRKTCAWDNLIAVPYVPSVVEVAQKHQ